MPRSQKPSFHILEFIVFLACCVSLAACSNDSWNWPSSRIISSISDDDSPGRSPYETRYVIIIVIDGPRYSETWGDSTHQYIPYFANYIANTGIISTNFTNEGTTYTVAGHTAITTGIYQPINNLGLEIPLYPSIFQCWRKTKQSEATSTWIISSKAKLEVLSDCQQPDFFGKFRPSTDCGFNGGGRKSADRRDMETLIHAKRILQEHHPTLALIQFREPDYSGHLCIWEDYLEATMKVDARQYELWDMIQTDPVFAGQTTVFLTNDHGRHLDRVADGFCSHGDGCRGCRHINFFASGPDFYENVILDTPHDLVDIFATTAELLNLHMPTDTQGQVMWDLFKVD